MSNVYNQQLTTKTPSCLQSSFIYPNYFRACSQVKLCHSFKQGWREGSVMGENMQFHT